MDRKTQEQLATKEWQTYLIKNYLQKQLTGMVRVFHGRYSSYITPGQMAEELAHINKVINELQITFTEPRHVILVGATQSQIQSGASPHPKKIITRVADDAERCHARVWGDSNHLVWRLPDSRVVYGCQCKRPKSTGSQYCAKHTKKLTHEDWFTEPSTTMQHHFVKSTRP
jgi:hypothetical protein